VAYNFKSSAYNLGVALEFKKFGSNRLYKSGREVGHDNSPTVCSVLIIVILLFNLLFRSMSSVRGVRRTAVQMPMLRGSRGVAFFRF